VGESETIWLVQPVSPGLNHRALARRLGFSAVMGAVPAVFVDPGRLVLVMGPPLGGDEQVARALDDSKWVAAWRRETWSSDGYPFDQDGLRLAPVPAGEPGAPSDYRRASELPDWPEGRLRPRPD